MGKKAKRGKKGQGKKAPAQAEKKAAKKARLREQVVVLADRVTVLEARVATLESAPATDLLLDIPGIGPRYADRLRAAGIHGVTNLMEANPADLAEQTGIPAKMIQGWIDATVAPA